MIDKSKFTEIIDGIWYEVETGLPWSSRTRRGGRRDFLLPINSFAGPKKAYYSVNINGKMLRWNRIVYNFFKGNLNNFDVDHIDNNTFNNRIDNLQLLSEKQNARKRVIQNNNKSGYAGVHWATRPRKFIAKIKVSSKEIHLGSFNNPEEAYQAYLQAKIKYHGAESITPLINKEK